MARLGGRAAGSRGVEQVERPVPQVIDNLLLDVRDRVRWHERSRRGPMAAMMVMTAATVVLELLQRSRDWRVCRRRRLLCRAWVVMVAVVVMVVMVYAISNLLLVDGGDRGSSRGCAAVVDRRIVDGGGLRHRRTQ